MNFRRFGTNVETAGLSCGRPKSAARHSPPKFGAVRRGASTETPFPKNGGTVTVFAGVLYKNLLLF